MFGYVIGAAVVGVAVLALLDGETRVQHQRFQRKEGQLRRETQQYREKIQQAMQHSDAYQEYKRYIEMHYASVQTANQAFELYASAKHVINQLYQQLQMSGAQIQQLKVQRDGCTGEAREMIRLQLHTQREIHEEIKQSIAAYKAQKQSYYQEIKQLNEATAQLKQYIRLNTGNAGRQWYERLEQRRLDA